MLPDIMLLLWEMFEKGHKTWRLREIKAWEILQSPYWKVNQYKILVFQLVRHVSIIVKNFSLSSMFLKISVSIACFYFEYEFHGGSTGTCFIQKIYAPSSSLLQGKHLSLSPSPLRLNIFHLFVILSLTQLYRYTPEIFLFSTAIFKYTYRAPLRRIWQRGGHIFFEWNKCLWVGVINETGDASIPW